MEGLFTKSTFHINKIHKMKAHLQKVFSRPIKVITFSGPKKLKMEKIKKKPTLNTCRVTQH